jgi:hypothetical protein
MSEMAIGDLAGIDAVILLFFFFAAAIARSMRGEQPSLWLRAVSGGHRSSW